MFSSFSEHKKCPINSELCNFCLLRSAVYKINSPKGRQAIIPQEVECQSFRTADIPSLLQSLLNNANQSFPMFGDIIESKWTCSCCSKEVQTSVGNIIQLDNESPNRDLNNLLKLKEDSIKYEHFKKVVMIKSSKYFFKTSRKLVCLIPKKTYS